MVWLGYVYLVILMLFGASALLDDIKAKKMNRFAISLVPFAVLVIATVGFLFLPKPDGLAWLVFAALAVSIPILIWDVYQDVKELSKTDPEFGTGGAIFSSLLVALVFIPAIILGVLWAR
jgi:hypothetical protein